MGNRRESHHSDQEFEGFPRKRWKNIGRPYWSHDAYSTFRKYFFLIPEAERFARDGALAHCTLPKKKRNKLDGLHHEHVVPQKDSLDLLISGEDPALVVARNLGAVITEREARDLPPRHPRSHRQRSSDQPDRRTPALDLGQSPLT